jgi:PAS domain S-box-containing protein
MVEDITEKKKAEEARLRQSAIVESCEDAIISKNLDGVITSWNSGAQHIFGYKQQEAIGKPITILIPHELLGEEQEILGRLKAGERIGNYETVRVTKAGERVSVSLTLSPIKDATGTLVGFSKIVRDISERKKTEQALAEMPRKLVDAQEQERMRIGRELHDDINQRLALAVIELEQWNQEYPNPEVDTQTHISHIKERLLGLGKDVQALAHRLHASKLEYLGLAVAAKSFCKELSEQQKVEIDFTHEGVPKNAPKEISLCLFRILQEALQNAIKYSGVRRFTVKLERAKTEIQLTITDRGVGFDQQTALSGRGLGLISMRERIHLVKGKLSITSHPDCGTTVYARVPFATEDHPMRLAG